MKIVIKLPEDDYKRIIKDGMTVFGSDADIVLLERALKNGKPLPKGHGRLIDADALPLYAIDDANYGSNYIRIAPTIIEADKEEEKNDV